MDVYLQKLAERLRVILGANLVGVYLQGSGAQKDYKNGKSDIDVITVVNDSIPDNQKDLLALELSHNKLPVPAAGLDLMIVTINTARNPTPNPEYEFWFATGKTWQTEVDRKGQTSEVLIFLATCAEQAETVYGLASKQVFTPVPYEMLLKTLIDILEWHRKKILDHFHDPLGQYSVLNASRAWMYADEKILGSKSKGGQWVLEREPKNDLVRNALSIREGRNAVAPQSSDIDAFLLKVLEICRSKLSV